MPNHITNKIKFIGSGTNVENAMNAIKGKYASGEETCIDFEKIIPMPPHIFRGNLSFADEEKYGKENCWYHWSVTHWGTKWGAYDDKKVNRTTIQFDTAWAHPMPIIIKLSQMFPNIELLVQYADEDIGSNLGEYRIMDGKMLSIREFATHEDEIKFACEIKGRDYEEYKKDCEEWEKEKREFDNAKQNDNQTT